jgi:putative Mg2+ transporter-C (MgtC) family protein
MKSVIDTSSVLQELFYVLKLVFAFVLGGIIGWERELAGKEAGIRTFGCIAMGSAAFSIFSPLVNFADNSRIAAQIVLGIGFLGSGIFMRGEKTAGLTTAASMWVSAAVGMAVGFSLYIVATGLALITAASLHMPSLKYWKILSGKSKKKDQL